MKNIPLFVYIAFLLIHPTVAISHPAWGIHVDEAGNIYFTDLFHNQGSLWKLDRRGHLRAIMTKLHSHSLSAGPEGSIWVADYQFIEGFIEGDGENTLYRIDNRDRPEELTRTRNGSAFYGNNIAVDSDGAVFFIREKRLYKWSKGQEAAPISNREFGRIITSYASRDGCIYIVDNNLENGSLIRVDPADGQTETIANNLLEEKPADPPFENPLHNMLFGIGQNEAGDFFVCNSGSRLIWQITNGEKKKVAFRSEDPWYPAGITFRDGSAIVMECGYQEGKGHLGPRILEWKPGAAAPEVLVEVGKDLRPDCEWCGAMDAPPNPGWQARIPPLHESGEPLIMEGRVLQPDGKSPAADVIIYVYHTNNEGIYPKWGDETGNGKRHGYLRAWMKTDADGRYRFTTIRPKPYPNRDDPAHIHITLTPPGREEYWIDSFWFKGDPLITKKQLRSVTRPAGDSNIVELIKDDNGVWRGKRDLVLEEF